MQRGYVPLWVNSNFSFLRGASHPEELVDQAHALALPGLALTDRDGVYGLVQAHARARQLGMKLLLGAELTLGELERADTPDRRLLLLAADREGYGNLCRLISIGRLRCEKGSSLLTLQEVCSSGRGLLALSPHPELLPGLLESFGDRLYAIYTRHLLAEERPAEEALRQRACRLGVPTVAGNRVLYHRPERQDLHDVLCCIRRGTTLSAIGRHLRPNAEHALKPLAAMRRLFADDPASLGRTLEVAARCDFSLCSLRYRYPAEGRPGGKSESDWLRELTLQGARQRYDGQIPAGVLGQLERELELIHELDYGGYFLTIWEIVQFCRQQNILCQGRGSAANSAVCYCLGITAVDPVKLDLLFERFISRERAEPPDIDLDIEHRRREEVIQFVYKRYGRRHAAMVANFVRYRTRSAVREVGKALGLPPGTLDRLSGLLGSYLVDFDESMLKQAGFDTGAKAFRHLLRLAGEIRRFPRHLSIHPGGFLLGHEPVDSIVPIEPATMPDRTVIQWDKYAIEELGLFKVDLLGLGALSQVHQCLDLVREHQGVDLQLGTIPQEDPETYRMISAADTVGVFQIESRAQMSMLPRLKPATFYDLVMEVAIVRPGPIQGDMVHPYLNRRNRLQQVEYPHPSLERILKKTLGVPIFQEQVMKIAVVAADYTPGEADQLRRDMSAWRSSGRIEQHRERLIQRMAAKGIPIEFAERIFSQIRGFGEYGFPESHAASFAVIVYATAWLKRHHPAAFTCALLNCQPMGFYSPATIVENARRGGVEVRPIDAQQSGWHCSLEPLDAAGGCGRRRAHAVRLGLGYVKGMSVHDQQALERAPGPGRYRDLEDFARRSGLGARSLGRLAQAGAFDCFGLPRRDALFEVRALARRLGDTLPLSPPRTEQQPPGFPQLRLPEQIFWDYRTSRCSTRGHPLQLIRGELSRRGIPDAKTLNSLPDASTARYVGLVICRQQPATKSRVTFYTLEDETGFVNLVVWHPTFKRNSVLCRTALLLGVSGRIQSPQPGVVYLIADRLWDPRLAFPLQSAEVHSFR